MSESHFIVCLRGGAWQHTHRGTTSAPFTSRAAAIEAAIDEARKSGDPAAEVIVQASETSAETVWRSAEDGRRPT